MLEKWLNFANFRKDFSSHFQTFQQRRPDIVVGGRPYSWKVKWFAIKSAWNITAWKTRRDGTPTKCQNVQQCVQIAGTGRFHLCVLFVGRRRGRLVSWNIRHGNRSGRRAAAAGGASRIVLWPLERLPRREGGEVVQPPVHKCQSEQSDSILYILLLELCVLCGRVSVAKNQNVSWLAKFAASRRHVEAKKTQLYRREKKTRQRLSQEKKKWFCGKQRDRCEVAKNVMNDVWTSSTLRKKNNNREDGEAKRKLREELRVHTCECVRCVLCGDHPAWCGIGGRFEMWFLKLCLFVMLKKCQIFNVCSLFSKKCFQKCVT